LSEGSVPDPPQLPRYADPLELMVKVTGLVALVVPVVGAGIRATAFLLAGIPNPINLAIADSLGGLASTTLEAIGFNVVFVAALAFVAHRGWLRTNPWHFGKVTRFTWRLWSAVAILVLGTLAAFAWPGGVLLQGGSWWGGWLLGDWSARGTMTFYRAASAVIVVGIFGALAAGTSGWHVGDQVNNYEFTTESGMIDGKYVRLGESDGLVYLDACGGQGIVGVNQAVIVKVRPGNASPADNPTLFDVIVRGRSPVIGYKRRC